MRPLEHFTKQWLEKHGVSEVKRHHQQQLPQQQHQQQEMAVIVMQRDALTIGSHDRSPMIDVRFSPSHIPCNVVRASAPRLWTAPPESERANTRARTHTHRHADPRS